MTKNCFFHKWQERYELTGMKTKNKPLFSTEMLKRVHNFITWKSPYKGSEKSLCSASKL